MELVHSDFQVHTDNRPPSPAVVSCYGSRMVDYSATSDCDGGGLYLVEQYCRCLPLI